MLAFERVTSPDVVLLRADEPPKNASTVPLCISKVPVLERTPVVPVMLPLERVTVPTVSLYEPILRVPPLTVTAPVLITLFAP